MTVLSLTPSTPTLLALEILRGTSVGYTKVIAASDTPIALKDLADYVCDGTADEVEINAAITAVAASGTASILCLPGTYYLAAAVDFSPVSPIAGTPLLFEAEAAIFHAAANMTSMFVVGYLGGGGGWLASRLILKLGTVDGGKGTYTVAQAVYMTRIEDCKVWAHSIQNVSGNGVTVDCSAALSTYMGVFGNLVEIGRIYNTSTAFQVLTSTNVFQFQGNLVRIADVLVNVNGFVVGSTVNDYSYWNHFDIGAVSSATANGVQDKCGRNIWNITTTNGNAGFGITCPASLTYKSTFILGNIADTISALALSQNLVISGGEVISSQLHLGDGTADPELRFHSGLPRSNWDTRIFSNFGDGVDGHGNLHVAAGLVILDTGPISTNATIEATGAGSAALGANSPAGTLTAPYKWLKFHTSDGSTVYVPAWK